jgi:hypothetical protein
MVEVDLMLNKTILWTSPEQQSAEYFTLTEQTDGFLLAGIVNLWLEDQPTQIIYDIQCDSAWITRRVELRQRQRGNEKRLLLTVDEALNWYNDGVLIPWATGLTDIDISVTPSTNMLPIRKLPMETGKFYEVNCVWVQPPTLALATLPQHYTRMNAHEFDYAAPSQDYTAILTVDDDSVIVKYGDLFTQPGR